MINFVEKNVVMPVLAKSRIDEDGDFVISLDGIDVMFIDSSDGSIKRFFLGLEEERKLINKGLSIVDGYLKFEQE